MIAEERKCGNCKYYDAKDYYCIKHHVNHGASTLCTRWKSNKTTVCGYCAMEIEGAIFVHEDKKVCESCFADYTSFDNKLKNDEVNHPKHYTQLPIECKDVIKHFDACRGQAIKYIWRCEDKGKRITDLKKAIFWLNEKIKMYESEGYDE
jgi:hypothetical protein